MEKTFDIMTILPLIIPLVILQLVLMIYCLVDLSRRSTVKSLPKWGWALIIILGEFFGPIVYLLIGRGED